ncbi:Eco29kI family restriction endonuclease [Aurantimonas sp. A2-1-M11]|uniref:Eco29kI family restriction endonuclease n=1 Tax=Aurantimonas sp. A2-1-M11 TaxID=3113712 RepID=UPI002F944268
MPEGYGEFEVDIAALMRSSLPAYFDGLNAVPLLTEYIAEIPFQAQGAYLLLLNGTIVYVGKTDAQAGFRYRLTRHFHNVQHRQHLDPADVSFKAVRVFVFNMFDLETMLIEEYTRVASLRPIWNTSGFGSNDPGHRRENQDPALFDVRHPVDIDREIKAIDPGTHEILAVLLRLKDLLPYTFRYEADGPGRQAWRQGHADMRGHDMTVPTGPQTTRSILQAALNAMGPEWQATVLPNRVILYKEDTTYPAQVEAFRANP